ncbi:MAG: cyclase family protein [Chloroflexota bacterium]|nr:cyclase family protein [Chloroflexota bacterium]
MKETAYGRKLVVQKNKVDQNRPAGAGWIDVSVPLRDAMVHWPGDPPVIIKRVTDVARGDSHTLSEISLGSHTGTHIDAPVHFLRQGMGIDRMPADITVGRARVIEIKDAETVKPGELAGYRLRAGERILFKTQNSGRVWRTDNFVEDFVYISKEAADFLAKRRLRVVGIDYLSVGGYHHDGAYVHRALLGSGVWLIEGLDLSGVAPGSYDLACLPLKIEGGDGAPARAFLRPVKSR